MPTSLANAPRLSLEDLTTCDEVDGIRHMFGVLGYSVNATLPLLTKANLDLSPANDTEIDRVYLIADQEQQLRVLLFRLRPERDTQRSSAPLRSIAADLVAGGGNYLLLFAETYPFQRLTFVNPRRLAALDGRPRVQIRKLTLDTHDPKRSDLDVLRSCAVDGRSADRVYLAQCEAFDVDRIASNFYFDYARLFHALEDKVKSANRNAQAFHNEVYLSSFTQRLLGRVLFLYFLQHKGWLGGDPQFLTTNYRQTVIERNGQYYDDFLDKLFFETLNQRRTDDASPWGKLPFVNGGLFEKEQESYLNLPNALFDPESSSGILGFFNEYNFVAEEDTRLEKQAALNPEMIGKALELLLAEKRPGKGEIYYIPRPIVRYMCREALVNHLQGATGLSREFLQSQFHAEIEHALNPTQANALESALRDIRVVDPAVGSGEFLVGMLQEATALERACCRSLRDSPTAARAATWQMKRELVANCLYGVDSRREAVEIARWRLWLSLVADAERERLEPLPNLDYKIMRGNLLIETLGGKPILIPTDDTPGGLDRRGTQLTLNISESEHAIADLQKLKDEYAAADPKARTGLQIKIQAQEQQIVLAYLLERETALEYRIKALLHKGRELNWKEMQAEKNQIDFLQSSLVQIGELTGQMRQGATLPFFLYRLHFSEVFKEKNGFDIVLGNLPRALTDWTIDQKLALQNEYPRVYHPFAGPSVYYVQRGLDLLRTGGTLALIPSEKLLRASNAAACRQMLQETMSLLAVLKIDQTVSREASDESIVLVVRRTTPGREHVFNAHEFRSLDSLEQIDELVARRSLHVQQSRLSSAAWAFFDMPE